MACGGTSANPTVLYGYDLNGRLIAANDNSAAITIRAERPQVTQQPTHTIPLNRPVTVSWNPAPVQTTPTASSTTFTLGYDANNRRNSTAATDNSWWSYPANSASTLSYTANALNQYSAVGAVSPTYDGNGNLTSDGTFTYGYDAENRLTGITQGATTIASYSFDPLGRRKSKTIGSTTTIYLTDADNREVLEYDGTTGAIANWYAYGLGSNDVLNQMNVTAGTRQTLIPDTQGSLQGSLDLTPERSPASAIRPMARTRR